MLYVSNFSNFVAKIQPKTDLVQNPIEEKEQSVQVQRLLIIRTVQDTVGIRTEDI